MKNRFLSMALGLVGIIGTLLLGVVNANGVTITYDLSGGYRVEDGSTETKEVQFQTDGSGMVSTTDRKTPSRGDECEEYGVMKKCMFDGWYLENGARWTGYADTDMRVYAEWLPFEDKDIPLGDITITIMDRNLGATVSGTGCSYGNDDGTCGYYFQWGNNYGFKSSQNDTFPNGEKRSSDTAIDREGHTSTYYNGIWRTTSSWNSGAQAKDNLWGGSEASNSDIDRQGPCPNGYHVPDTLEWKAIGTLLNAGSNGNVLSDELNLPFAGNWDLHTNWNFNIGGSANYWSSTPDDRSNFQARTLYFNSSQISPRSSLTRNHGGTVRCFRNSSTNTLAFSVGNDVLVSKNPRWWEPVTESYAPDAPEIKNADFMGWFLDGSDDFFAFGSDVYIPRNTTLSARYKCNLGYFENEQGTGCEKIRVEFDANGGSFGDKNISIIEPDLVQESQKFVTYSHTPNLDDGGNQNGSYIDYNYNKNDMITITGAKNLHIKINYGFFIWGRYQVDYVSMRTGNHPYYTVIDNSSTSITSRLGGSGSKEYDVEGDTVTFAWYTTKNGGGYGYYAIIEGTGAYIAYPDDAFNNISQPSREGHSFKGWYLSDGSEFDTGNVSTGEVTHVYAKWECAHGYVDKQGQCVKEETKPSGGSSGGGGGGGGSSNTSKDNQKETSKNDASTGTTIKEPEDTGNNTKIQTGSKIDSSEQATQNDSNTKDSSADKSASEGQKYTQEFQQAYEFAKGKGITTMPTIQKANMDGKLTRIAMAKMLSQYAMNVLGQKPENIITPKFNDVSDKQNSDYDDGVTLAYQLGIMGQNMPNNKFRPNDEVTRAEFATALSRMIYHTSDGEYKSTPKYYIHHMEKLVKEGIITKDDPNMKELRGYVMIMLMRSAK